MEAREAHGRRPSAAAIIDAVPAGVERPLWSVMIPTFNCAHYLRDTLASVLAQDLGPEQMQIEVVDDCSTSDDPAAVVEELGRGRIAFHRQAQNVGHGANFNTCLRRSRGELVHLLHGDDCVLDGFYRTMTDAFGADPEVGAAFCRHVYMDADGHWQAIGSVQQPRAGRWSPGAAGLAARLPVQPPAMVVRRRAYELVGGFDERFGIAGEDIEMWVRIAARFPMWYEPRVLALYRGREGSLIGSSTRSARNMRDSRHALELARQHLAPSEAAWAIPAARAKLARWGEKNAVALLQAGDRRAALRQLNAALSAAPSPLLRARIAAAVVAEPLRREERGAVAVAPSAAAAAPASGPPVEPPSPGPRPRWSVMIPTYNCSGYLRETLASVLAQDPGPEHMQIEVVDDGSDDDPAAVVDELAPGRVTFHRQPRNVGQTQNLNTCLRRSRGELVHVLHGDDCVRDGFYRALEGAFSADPGIGAAFCRYIGFDEAGHWRSVSRLEARTRGRLEGWLGRIALGQRLQVASMVVRRTTYEQVGGFGDWPYALDWEMWVRIAARFPVWYEPEPLALYRVHSASVTGELLRSGANARDLRRVIAANERHFAPEQAREITREAVRVTALTCVRRARRLLHYGDHEGMWAQLREAVRQDPAPGVLVRAGAVVARRFARPLVHQLRARSGERA